MWRQNLLVWRFIYWFILIQKYAPRRSVRRRCVGRVGVPFPRNRTSTVDAPSVGTRFPPKHTPPLINPRYTHSHTQLALLLFLTSLFNLFTSASSSHTPFPRLISTLPPPTILSISTADRPRQIPGRCNSLSSAVLRLRILRDLHLPWNPRYVRALPPTPRPLVSLNTSCTVC